jgi:hypothetical protein
VVRGSAYDSAIWTGRTILLPKPTSPEVVIAGSYLENRPTQLHVDRHLI